MNTDLSLFNVQQINFEAYRIILGKICDHLLQDMVSSNYISTLKKGVMSETLDYWIG